MFFPISVSTIQFSSLVRKRSLRKIHFIHCFDATDLVYSVNRTGKMDIKIENTQIKIALYFLLVLFITFLSFGILRVFIFKVAHSATTK